MMEMDADTFEELVADALDALPDDMVGPCLFLASDASAMITAQTQIVEGGVL